MPPRKRAAEDDGAGPTTRSAKAPKTDSPAKGRGGRGKKGPKANLGAASFKARALPLHVNITHTPPVLADDGTVTLASTDPGFIGSTTLTATSFNTGSYGWKGSKRLTIELPNPDGGDDKEKVHVMLTINATVMGSKGAKDDDGEPEGEAKEENAEDAADAADVDAEKAVEEAVAEEPMEETKEEAAAAANGGEAKEGE